MMTRRSTPAVELDGRRVAAWRLARQRLDPTSPVGRHEQVATELIGIQAQVASAAELSLALRVRNGRLGKAARLLSARRLVKSWAMRGTLHLFAADDFPVVVAALRSRETWREPVWLRYFGVTLKEMEAVIASIGEVLDDGQPRTRAELGEALGRRLGPKAGEGVRGSWGTFLKPAAYRGLLCQAASDGTGVTFVRPDRWLDRWRTEDPTTALIDIVRRYLAAYGPASPAEVARWWGVPLKTIRPPIAALEDELLLVDVDGVRGLVLGRDLEAIRRTEAAAGGARLLGPFDPFTVGAGLREMLIPAEHQKRVSRIAGWISPVVLIDGRVAGVWTSERRRGRLLVTVDPFGPLKPLERRGIARETERLGAIHELEASLDFGPVFAAPSTASGAEA